MVGAVLAASCSDGDRGGDVDADGGGGRSDVVASVGDEEFTEAQVAELVADPAYRSYAQIDDEPPADGDLVGSDAGRIALSLLIQDAAIEAERERRGLEVTDEDLAAARATLEPEDPGPGESVKQQHELFGEAAGDRVARSIANHVVLDEALRQSNPDDPAQQADVLGRAPSVAEKYCGPGVVVDAVQEQALRDQIAAGTPVDDIDDKGVPVRAETDGPGGRCILVAESTDEFVNLLDGLQEGEVAIGPGRSATGEPLVYATQFESREMTTGAEATEAARLTLAQLRDNGYSAYQRLLYLDLEPDIDPEWGRWEAQFGLLAPDAALPFSTEPAVPTTTTTTTTAPPVSTTAPPPPPPPPDPRDPGTGDLVARGQAALNAGVPQAWRDAVPIELGTIGGATSLSYPDGRLEMGTSHLSGPWDRLVAIVSHEFGHHIAFRYGTQAELGAAPAGWPSSGSPPVERWADCVARSFTAYPLGSHGMSACEDPSLGWTRGFLQAGPAAAPRTG